ncbi:ATP-binding cassette domain-containing protein [Paludibacterium denitrificans]|uniref:ATP-binding cassette domain-containing protein n=1 Tax=Paludibacterium denitrificans TaxID=2675226 RepID=UPI001E52F117|nr:ATP-binding cassette domain-containing protein [Paludibacterium denitrificans]
MSARDTLQESAVVLSGLTKRFGERTVLNGLDLHIPVGQFVAVVGRSGCGKSTLLRLVAALEQPDEGLLANRDADQVRVMFQDARLLPWKTVLDNVGLGLRGDWQARAQHALQEVGLG